MYYFVGDAAREGMLYRGGVRGYGIYSDPVLIRMSGYRKLTSKICPLESEQC